jgi:sucrose synthase
MRWLPMQTEKNIVGEIYRVTADLRGAFVQPALFEAFGLTVIEAMASGLPVFATRFGGPLEIIEDGTSGFHIDPNHGDAAARSMAGFFKRCGDDASYWDAMSKGAIDRVRANYTWNLYARRILSLSRVYGFWKHISTIEREETRRYIEMLYGLMYRPLAANVPESAD